MSRRMNAKKTHTHAGTYGLLAVKRKCTSLQLQYCNVSCVLDYSPKPLFIKNLNVATCKPPEQSKGLGGNIGSEDKNSTWY